MIESPLPNTRSHPYRGLSVQHVERFPSPEFVRTYLMGREVYRRTDYLALIHDDAVALAAVTKDSVEPLFSPVTDVAVWSGPDQTMLIDDPTVDVGNATALARTALTYARPGISAYVIKGRFEHINFIWQPSPIKIRVAEITPPDPPKLLQQASQVVDFDEDMPPIELVADTITFPDLATTWPADAYLLPCRGAGTELPGDVAFLDTRPETRQDWVLIGCERSRQFHHHFYGDDPPQVDICPRNRGMASDPSDLWLTKCCLLERGIEYTSGRAVVPWGANLDEVRLALRLLTGVQLPEPIPA